MSTLKVGLMGCGRIAQSVHLPVLSHLPGVQLVALAEVDPERLKKAILFAPKAVPYSHYKKLLEMDEVEAGVICLPNDLHAEAAVASLELGKHLYLEKPLAMTLEEGRKVLQAWQKAGTVGMIGFNFRFHPLYKAARQAIQLGRIGDLVSVRSVFSTATQYSATCERSRQVGGLLLDLASHHVDLILFFLGQEVQNVWAAVKPPDDAGTLQLGERLPSLEGRSMLNWSEVEMKRWWIDFGAHTLTHRDLTCLPLDQVRAEICDSKIMIEDALNAPVLCFTAPYSRYDDRSLEIIRQHFACACSDKLGLITAGNDLYTPERVDAYYLRTDRLFDLILSRWLPEYIRVRSIPHWIRRTVESGLG